LQALNLPVFKVTTGL